MDGYDFGRLTYFVLLLAAIGGYFFVQNRHRLGQMIQHAAIWALIFLGVIAAMGLWSDIRHTVLPHQALFKEEGRIEVGRSPDGHFHLTLRVNGEPVQFVVDTGATDVVLTRSDAEKVGLVLNNLAFTNSARTANGVVRTAPVRLSSVELGNLQDTNIRAFVNEGEMHDSLLGMSYLQRFEKIEITRNKLTLSY